MEEPPILKESVSDPEGDVSDQLNSCPDFSTISNSFRNVLQQRFKMNEKELAHVKNAVKKNKYNYVHMNLELLCSEGLKKDGLIYCPGILTLGNGMFFGSNHPSTPFFLMELFHLK